jgi:4,5:9,10-diseco-3-hydroxy-5,9,17-trioxoandrosta-1(10),2-diene-4-oate hydrolase
MMSWDTCLNEHTIEIEGFTTRYITAGSGPALLLLHAAGENATDWRWTIPLLARTHRVIAPDLLVYNVNTNNHEETCTPRFSAEFIGKILLSLGIDHPVIVGNSIGGLVAMHLALSGPVHVRGLVLVASAGLGRELNPALIGVTVPGFGEVAASWGEYPLGAIQRAYIRSPMLFACPTRAPHEWYAEQVRLAQVPGYLAATVQFLRAQVGLFGQIEVLTDELPRLDMPTMVIWGESDLLIPALHACDAVKRLRIGELVIMPNCGHLPQVEHPEKFAATLGRFLSEKVGDN